MTIVVALACQHGVVLAADSEFVGGGPPQLAVRRQPKTKIRLIANRLAWGFAGDEGLAQEFEDLLQKHEHKFPSMDTDALADELAVLAGTIMRQASARHAPHPSYPQPELNLLLAWCSDHDHEPNILQVSAAAHPTRSLTHAAIGSGHFYATYAMVTLGAIDAPSLTMEQAKVVAYRTIDDLIQYAAFGIGPPIIIGEVTPTSAALLDDPQGQLETAVELWRAAEIEALGKLAGGTTPPAKPPHDPGIKP